MNGVDRYVVRKHAGRSGKSVFGWRLYHETRRPGGKLIRIQLGKYRTDEAARSALRWHERRAVAA